MTDADRLVPAEPAAEAAAPAAAQQASPAAEHAPVAADAAEPAQTTKKPKAAPRRKAAKAPAGEADGAEAAPAKKKPAAKAPAKKKPAAGKAKAKAAVDEPAEPQQAPAAEQPQQAPAAASPEPAPKPKRSHKARPKPEPKDEAPAPAPAETPAPAAQVPAAEPLPVSQEPLEAAETPRAAKDAEPERADSAKPDADSEQDRPAPEAPRPAADGTPSHRRPPRVLPRPVDEMTVDELIELFPPARRGRPSKREKQNRQAREALLAARENPTPELMLAARSAVLVAVGERDAYKAPASDAPARQDVQAEAPAAPETSGAPAPDAPETAPEGGYGQRRRHHDRRAERDGKPWQKGQPQPDQRQRDPKHDRDGQQRQRDGKPQQGFSAQDRQFGKNGRKARRDYVVEPKVSREELEELKVGDLRAKATELGIDPAGLKKPELIDAVYAGLFKQEGFFEFQGVLDLANEGHGHVRTKGYLPSEHDVYVAAGAVRANALRRGDYLVGIAHMGRPGDKYPGVTKILSVNGKDPEEARNRPRFGDLTPVFPSEPLTMEHGKDSILGRCIDLVSPVGKGQRGLIVSPPKAGKTTVLKKIAESIAANNPEVHLICLLVDERPEEVTDMQRSIRGEVVASTFDMPCDNHIAVSELVSERAKRLVEQGGDVVILLDSITRLARAYNLAQPASGRILSGGVDSTALYPPKRFLGAARNIENGGSLTILASALVDTGSKMDEVIFEEFKGTGNMELKLDRDLADRRIFPAIDPVASGTRKEELLLDANLAPFVWGVRRILANMNNNERAMTMLIKSLKATQTNEEFLIRSAKKAQQQEMNVEL